MFFFFFFNDTATTEIYTLSLHDALPIFFEQRLATEGAAGVYAEFHVADQVLEAAAPVRDVGVGHAEDRKSTRLNSSHGYISYAVFCLKKKKQQINTITREHHRTPEDMHR